MATLGLWLCCPIVRKRHKSDDPNYSKAVKKADEEEDVIVGDQTGYGSVEFYPEVEIDDISISSDSSLRRVNIARDNSVWYSHVAIEPSDNIDLTMEVIDPNDSADPPLAFQPTASVISGKSDDSGVATLEVEGMKKKKGPKIFKRLQKSLRKRRINYGKLKGRNKRFHISTPSLSRATAMANTNSLLLFNPIPFSIDQSRLWRF